MTNNFDSPKHFFANVFNTLVTELLPITDVFANPLVALHNERNSHLQETIITLLSQASKGFPQCIYLKDSLQAQ